MPTYKVTDPETGRTISLQGDSPPSESELNEIFGSVRDSVASPSAAPESGLMDKLGFAGSALSQLMPGGMRQAFGQAQDTIAAERSMAQGIGKAGKAITESVAEVSPTAGSVAEFALPQDELGGTLSIFAPVVGAAGGAVVRGAFAGGKKVGGALSAGAQNLMRYAESKGLKFTAAELADSKVISSLENLLEKTPLGSGSIQKFRDKQIGAIRAMRDKLAERFGTREDAEVVGQIAKDAVKASSQAMKADSDALYSRLGELSQGKEIPLTRASSVAADLLEKEIRLRPELRNQGIMKAAADVLGVDVANITEDTLPFIRENLPKFTVDYPNFTATQRLLGNIIDEEDAARALGAPGVKFLSSAEAGAAKALRKATSQDLAEFSAREGGELKAAHDAAASFYKDGIAVFNDRTIKGLLRSNPEKIVDVVFRPGAVTPIRAVKQASGPAFQGLRKQFVEKLIPEVGEKFSPAAFQRNLDKYGEATLREIFTPQELMQFRALARLSGMAQKAEGLSGTFGSARTNTAVASGILSGATGVTGLLLGHPVTGILGGAGFLLGPKAIAELYLSEAGRKLLTQGYTVKAGTEAGAKAAGAITAYLAGRAVAKTAGEKERNP